MVSAEGIAWFLMGEGSMGVIIAKHYEHRLGYAIYPGVELSNTEKVLLTEIEDWCKERNITCYIEERKEKRKKKWRTCYVLRITNYKNVEPFLQEIVPFLKGVKKRQAELLLSFCKKFRRSSSNFKDIHLTLEEEKRRFLEAMKIRDQLIEISPAKRHQRKYDYLYFVNLFRNANFNKNKPERSRFFWTDSEIEYLKANYLKLTDAELAKRLGRSIKAVACKRRKLNLRKVLQ